MLVQWACFICKKIVDSKLGLLMHFDEEHSNATYYKQTASAHGGVYQVYSKDLGVGVGDVFHSFEIMCSKDMYREFEEIVQRFLVQQSAGKVSLIVTALFSRVRLFFQKLSDHSLQLPKVEHFDKIEHGIFRFGLTFTK